MKLSCRINCQVRARACVFTFQRFKIFNFIRELLQRVSLLFLYISSSTYSRAIDRCEAFLSLAPRVCTRFMANYLSIIRVFIYFCRAEIYGARVEEDWRECRCNGYVCVVRRNFTNFRMIFYWNSWILWDFFFLICDINFSKIKVILHECRAGVR